MAMADCGSLDNANSNKTIKYKTIEGEEFVRNLHKAEHPCAGEPKIEWSGAVMDWRGWWANSSARFLKKIIGTPSGALEYMAVRCLLS